MISAISKRFTKKKEKIHTREICYSVKSHQLRLEHIMRKRPKPQTKIGQQGSSRFAKIGNDSKDLERRIFFGRRLRFSDGSARESPVKHGTISHRRVPKWRTTMLWILWGAEALLRDWDNWESQRQMRRQPS